MNIQVKVVPRAHRDLVKKEGEKWKVYLTAPAVDGRANAALIDVLSRHFQLRPRHIQIIKGLKSRNKTISINGVFSSPGRQCSEGGSDD